MPSLPVYRHLTQASTPEGHFVVLAIDHRANLRASLNQAAPAPLSDADFTAFKLAILHYLLPSSSAVLIDPYFGLARGIAEGFIPPSKAFLAPLEETDYTLHPSQRRPTFIPQWGVAGIKRAGGAGAKFLLYYHPDAADAGEKRALVAQLAEECQRHALPFYLEPLAYSPDPSRPLAPDELRQVVIESARTFSPMGITVLKTEFPLDVKTQPDPATWGAALAELDAACAVPWVLLSAGVSYEVFYQQAEAACRAGASGVMVGRAVWAEAVTYQGQERIDFLASTARPRMEALAALCRITGRDWRTRVPMPNTAPTWFKED